MHRRGHQSPDHSHTSTNAALHFIPLGLEAVVSPTSVLDIGARFFLDGYVGQSGGSAGFNYFDFRALMLWFRVRV